MITLFKKRDSQFGNDVYKKLNDLIITFEVEELPEDADAETFIKESGKEVKGKQAIDKWLNQLEKELSWQRSLSGDGCYIDPETGETC